MIEGLVGLIGQTAIQLLARCLRERFPGSTHVRKFCIAALRGERIGHQQGAHCGLGQVYLIIVPADLAIRQNADASPVSFDIGHVEYFGVLTGEILLPDVNLQITKLTTKAHERRLVEGLVPEQQQFVLRPQLSDRRNVCFQGCPGELEINHFRAEAGAQ